MNYKTKIMRKFRGHLAELLYNLGDWIMPEGWIEESFEMSEEERKIIRQQLDEFFELNVENDN